MTLQQLARGEQLSTKITEAKRNADKIHNYGFGETESCKYAMSLLDMGKYQQVKKILVDACNNRAEELSKEFTAL